MQRQYTWRMSSATANHVNFLSTGQAPDFLVCAPSGISVHGQLGGAWTERLSNPCSTSSNLAAFSCQLFPKAPWQHTAAISPAFSTARPCTSCCLCLAMSPVILCHSQRLPCLLTHASASTQRQLHCIIARSCPGCWLRCLLCAGSAVHRVNNFKGSIYMVFDYMDHDLTGLMERHGGFTVPQVRRLLRHVHSGSQA